MTFDVTVLIPTFKRAYFLQHVLKALEEQTYRNFDVLIVLKPSGDGTEQILEMFQKRKILNIRLVVQKKGYVTDALNLGMSLVKSKILAFLDDDAIPPANWLKTHVDTYSGDISGVAGNVVPAILDDDGSTLRVLKASEILPDYPPFKNQLARQLWNRPIRHQEDYLVYVSKAGGIEINYELTKQARQGKVVNSLLAMGTNLTLLTETIRGFAFSGPWVLGLPWDNYLGWILWKKGYKTVFNPQAKVYHLVHGETLSRGGLQRKKRKRRLLSETEYQLLYFRLLGQEKELSVVTRMLMLGFSFLVNAKKNPDQVTLNLTWLLLGNSIGLKWILSKKMGGSYSPLRDLEKLL